MKNVELAADVIAIVIAVVLKVAGEWKMLEKAGEKGWKALVPVYGDLVLFRLFWSTQMFWLSSIVTIFGAVAADYVGEGLTVSQLLVAPLAIIAIIAAFTMHVMFLHKVCKAFGHGVGFTFGFLVATPLFSAIVGFGKSEYKMA